jgi:L-lactate utilization protein LutC
VAVEPVESLWARFEATIQNLGGRVIHAQTLEEGLGEIGADAWIDPDLDSKHRNPDIWNAATGVTAADLAIAELGTVVVHNGPGRSRLGSLAPPVHVAVIRESQIVATLEEAVQSYPPGRTTVWITGSSRTADIEGVMVRGVHGPREIIVLVLPD